MDIVYIRELRIETIIGIFAWEREVLQVVSLVLLEKLKQEMLKQVNLYGLDLLLKVIWVT